MGISVRRATADDIGAIAEVFRTAALSNADDRDALLAHPELLEWSGEAVARGGTIVATTTVGQVVGFASLRQDETPELEDLFVDPPWMRRGIASRLLQQLRQDVAAAGGTTIEVTANPHAMDFYRATGFVDCGEVATELGTGRRMSLSVDLSGSGEH